MRRFQSHRPGVAYSQACSHREAAMPDVMRGGAAGTSLFVMDQKWNSAGRDRV